MEAYNEENKKESDSPLLNFDNMNSSLKIDNEEIKIKKRINLKVILLILVILIIVIVSIILIIYKSSDKKLECKSGYFLPDDSKSECHKCTLENCDKCFGTRGSNACSSCISNYFPVYENNILKKCNPCDIREEDKCLSCDEGINKCSKCNTGYKLENGKCILNYSFKATHFVDKNTKVTLINNNFKDKIKEVIIDGNIQTEINNVYELEYGNHIVFILLEINSLSDYMFYSCNNMKEIYFSSQFNNIEIKSMYQMFHSCKALTSIDFTNFKIKNVETMRGMF